jgi:chaperonin GroES
MEQPEQHNGDVSQFPEQFVAWATSGRNLVPDLDEAEAGRLSARVLADYRLDKDSMAEWLAKMEKAIKLAKMVKETRNWPFDNASNVKYPLLASAALQFNARAYPAIVPGDRVVKSKVWGADPTGQKAKRGERTSEFMSWQLLSQIEEWEPDTDDLLIVLAIVGEMFRKWWFDDVTKRPRCRLIAPGKLIVNDKVKSLDSAPRLTEEIPLYPGEIETRIRSGAFSAFEYTKDGEDRQAAQDFIEQHCRVDLDGDGYEEPYIATMHVETQQLVRLVADYRPEDVTYKTEQQPGMVMAEAMDPITGAPVMMPQQVMQEVKTGILDIRRGTYFVSYKLMPSMDGGFHGTGLGILLGDTSESIDTIINTLLDAGHYSSLGGGFIGSELRMKGGSQRMRPGEWKMISGAGDDARKAIVPMTWPGPDATLFQLLGLLIDAGREIASVKDVMTGEAGRANQPATTTLALIEQGMMVFTAAYKRIFRSMRREFKMLARINAETLDPQLYNKFLDAEQPADPAQDFGAADMDVEPVADPGAVTKMQQAAKAQLVMQLAETGMVDRGEALNRVTQAMDIPDVEKLQPKPDPMQGIMQQAQMAAMQAQLSQAQADIELTLAKVDSERAAAMRDMAEIDATQMGLKLDAIRMRLEDDRKRIADVLGTASRMAGKPGNGNATGGNGAGNGPAPQPIGGALLGGPAFAGPGQAGTPFG